MQTRKNSPVPDTDECRDLEMENIIGNLMISQHQVTSWDQGRANESEDTVPPVARKAQRTFSSTMRWCKWTVRVDKMAIIRFEMSEEIK